MSNARVAGYRPQTSLRIDLASVSISTSAWTLLIARTTQPASAVEIYNSGGSIIQLAVGGVGAEVAIPYLIPPNHAAPILALEIPGGARLSAKAIDSTPATGDLIINSFG